MMFSCAFVAFPNGVLCLCNAVVSVPCSLVITCWERTDVCDVFLCFCHSHKWCSGSCNAVVSVPCSLVITCLERTDVCDVFLCFCRFPKWCSVSL